MKKNMPAVWMLLGLLGLTTPWAMAAEPIKIGVKEGRFKPVMTWLPSK